MPDMQGKNGRRHRRQFRHRVRDGGRAGVRWAPASSSRLATPTRAVPPWRPSHSGCGGDAQVQLVGVRSRRPVLRAARRDRDPRAGTEAGRARQQRRAGADRAGRDGRRLRGNVRHEPPRPLPPDEPAARPDPGVGSVPDRQRGVDRPQHGPRRDPLRRPPVRRSTTARCASTGSRSWPTCSSRSSWRGGSRAAAVTANSLHPGHRAHGLRRRTAIPGACSHSGSRSAVPSSSLRPRALAPRSTWLPPPRWTA